MSRGEDGERKGERERKRKEMKDKGKGSGEKQDRMTRRKGVL